VCDQPGSEFSPRSLVRFTAFLHQSEKKEEEASADDTALRRNSRSFFLIVLHRLVRRLSVLGTYRCTYPCTIGPVLVVFFCTMDL